MIKRKTYYSINELQKSFMKEKLANGITAKTEETYKFVMEVFKKDMLLTGEENISVINKDLTVEWISKMQKTDLKVNSINKYIACYRTFIYWCVENEYLAPFKIKLIKSQEEIQKTYSEEELRQLLKQPSRKANFTEWRTYAAIAFMISLGARASTVINVKTEDLDFSSGTVKYAHLKNKKAAFMPLSPAMINTLKDYLKIFDRDTTWLFCNNSEKQLTVSGLRQAVKKYCKIRNVEYKGVHAFRRSFAKEYLQNGANVYYLQKMLNHSTLEMSRKYVALYVNDLKENFEKFSPLDNL